jgi:nucleoside-diphosphate-sugar epimerase
MAVHLVTGGAGFVGSHLATALAARGERVRILDNFSTGRAENLAHLAPGAVGSGARVELLEGDITDPRSAREACRGVAAVLHQAAQVSVPQSLQDPLRSYEINVMGTLRLLEAAREAGVARFLFAASSAAYGNSTELPKVETMVPTPLSPYASGKVAGEHLLAVWGQVHGLKTVALRYFNIFGPRQADDSPYTGVIALFAKALLEGRQATIFGDGEQTRDFTYVDNVVAANLLALERDLPPGTIVNVGSGQRVTVNALYAAMAERLGMPFAPNYAPPRAGDVVHSVASLELASRRLGYRPMVDWRTGLSATIDWYRARFTAQRA